MPTFIQQAIDLIKSIYTDQEYSSLSEKQKRILHIEVLDIVKGKALPVGTIRRYGKYMYVKHADGWVALTGGKKGKLIKPGGLNGGGQIHHDKHSDEVHGKFHEEHVHRVDHVGDKTVLHPHEGHGDKKPEAPKETATFTHKENTEKISNLVDKKEKESFGFSKDKTYSPDEVADYISGVTADGGGLSWLRDSHKEGLEDFGKEWVMREIPIDKITHKDIHSAGSDHDKAKVEKYQKIYEKTKDGPPLVVKPNGSVQDGVHRATAAKRAGVKTIKALVLKGSELDTEKEKPGKSKAQQELEAKHGENKKKIKEVKKNSPKLEEKTLIPSRNKNIGFTQFPTDRETEALEEYKRGMYGSKFGGFTSIQGVLREGKPEYNVGEEISIEDIKKEADILSSAIKRSKAKRDFQVFRGLRDKGGIFANLKVGDTFSDKGFTSTTSDRKIASKFSEKLNMGEVPTLLKINIKEGQSALPVEELVDRGGKEKEILLDKDSKFKIDSIKDQKGVKVITLTLQKGSEMEKSNVELAADLIKSTFTDEEYQSLSQGQKDRLHTEALNIVKGGKALPVGTVRTYGGKKYVKHSDGWVAMGGKNHGKLVERPRGKNIHGHENAEHHKKLADKHDGKVETHKRNGEKISEMGITSHPNYNKDDHAHLKGKGYTNEQIKEIWDRDKKQGKGPTDLSGVKESNKQMKQHQDAASAEKKWKQVQEEAEDLLSSSDPELRKEGKKKQKEADKLAEAHEKIRKEKEADPHQAQADKKVHEEVQKLDKDWSAKRNDKGKLELVHKDGTKVAVPKKANFDDLSKLIAKKKGDKKPKLDHSGVGKILNDVTHIEFHSDDYGNWGSKDVARYERHDHGGGPDGDDWMDEGQIQEQYDRANKQFGGQLKAINDTLKKNKINGKATIDIGEKGHVRINIEPIRGAHNSGRYGKDGPVADEGYKEDHHDISDTWHRKLRDHWNGAVIKTKGGKEYTIVGKKYHEGVSKRTGIWTDVYNTEDGKYLDPNEHYEVIKLGDDGMKKSTPYDMLEQDVESLIKGGKGSGRKKGPPPTKEQMEARIKDAKKRLKEAEAKGEHMEIVGLRNWLAQHDK